MRFGVTFPAAGVLAQPQDFGTLAAHVQALGFDSGWVTDHVAMPVQVDSRYPYAADGAVTWPAATPWLDPLTALTWAAAATDTLRLGTSILVGGLRHPLLLAKQAASVDYLSGGRLVLGLGAGWLAEEFALLDQPFERRYGRLAEQIALMRRCWHGRVMSYDGAFYRTEAFVMAPVQARDVPILIGGHGPAALRLVARHGDGWHPTHLSPAQYAECLDELGKLLDAERRDLSELELTVRLGSGTVLDDALVEGFRAIGVRLIVFDPDYSRPLDEICEALETKASELAISEGGEE